MSSSVHAAAAHRNAVYNAVPTKDIRLQSQHKISECMSQRYPFPLPADFDPTLPTIAYGVRSIDKILDVLRGFLEWGNDEADETIKKRENNRLLLGQLSTQTQKARAINSKAIAVQEQLLGDSDAEVRAIAAQVIAKLAMERPGRVDCCSGGCVDKLCGLLKDEYEQVQSAACDALHQLSNAEEAQRFLVSEPSVVTAIVQAIPDMSAKGLNSALYTLANLTRFEEGCDAALEAGAVPHIVKSLTIQGTADSAARCLVSVAGHPAGKVAAIACDALDSLEPLLIHERLETRRMAGSALVLLAVHSEGKTKSDGCVENLIKMLYDTDRDVAMNALLGLRSIAEYPMIRNQILARLGDDQDMFVKVQRDQQIHLAANRVYAGSQ